MEELNFTKEIIPTHFAVKEAVFPFAKFPGVDTLLGPEMKSTGEVMGLDSDFGRAFAKAQMEAGNSLPVSGSVLVSVRNEHHSEFAEPVRILVESGFSVIATQGTAATLAEHGIGAKVVKKTYEGSWHTVDEMENGGVDLVFNTVAPDPRAIKDSFLMRRVAAAAADSLLHDPAGCTGVCVCHLGATAQIHRRSCASGDPCARG